MDRREFLKKGAAAAGVAGLAAAGCRPPDQWLNEEKRKAFDEQRAKTREERLRQSEVRKIKEESGVEKVRDWDDNSRIEVQPFLEEEIGTWNEAVEAQKYYRKIERRFSFYGSYGGYDSFDHFLKEHPWLKKNSDIFHEVLELGDTEKKFIPGMQAPEEYRDWFEKYGREHEQFVTAMAGIESQFKQDLVGADGEIGMMQIKPTTAAGYGISELTNPENNIRAGCAHYEEMFKHTQDPWLAIAAYNAGLSRIQNSLLKALPRGAKPIEVIRRMKVIEGFPNTTRNYLIKAALALDYIDVKEAESLASNTGSVNVGIALKDKYNK